MQTPYKAGMRSSRDSYRSRPFTCPCRKPSPTLRRMEREEGQGFPSLYREGSSFKQSPRKPGEESLQSFSPGFLGLLDDVI